MRVQCFRLTKDVDYTLCIEILITDYQLWLKSRILIDKATSKGLTIGYQSYVNTSKGVEFMYCHRVIVNFRKTAVDLLYQLYLLVDIPQDGTDLQTYPQTFTGKYIVAYGTTGEMSDADNDKIYDYHTLFKRDASTAIAMNVRLDMNGKAARELSTHPR